MPYRTTRSPVGGAGAVGGPMICRMLPSESGSPGPNGVPIGGRLSGGCVSAGVVSVTGLGSVFHVDVVVNAGGQLVDGAEAHIDFDPSVLQVVDSDLATAGIQIAPGATSGSPGTGMTSRVIVAPSCFPA